MLCFGRLPTVPDLNAIVDEVGAHLPRKLKRDLPSRNLSRIAQDVVHSLPPKVREQLGRDATRPPYVVHAATAAADSPKYQHLCREWKTGHHFLSPMLTRDQKREAVEAYGEQEVREWRDWMAAEYRARFYAYGTRGLYLRRHFLAECSLYRRILESGYQAPTNWYDITSMMIRSKALVPSLYHRSGGKDYPSFVFSGGGARPEWK